MQKGLDQGLQERRKEGRVESGSALLGRQLARRVGPLPKAVTDRLAGATTEQLDRWAARVQDAHRLDDLFAQN
jgi:hypothetical protein